MSQTGKITERLLAHARLCRQMARESWDEVAAQELEKLAEECARAAASADPDGDPIGEFH